MDAIIYFATIDGVNVSEWFRKMQNYNPANSPDARYALTFDLWESFARVMVDSLNKSLPDLADLYFWPWRKYKTIGYYRIWISRVDWSPLTSKEIRQLEKDITSDLMFDYKEWEIDIQFDDIDYPGSLLVYVQDRDPEEDALCE